MQFPVHILMSLTVFSVAVAAQSKPVDLKKLKNAELMRCAMVHVCPAEYGDVIGELARRNRGDLLARSYARGNKDQRAIIVEAIYQYKVKGLQAREVMRRVAYSAPKNAPAEIPLWFPLQYLAERCEPVALNRLLGPQNYGDHTPLGCIYWQNTIRQFGKCRYRPAIKRLKEVANTAYACLDIPCAAEKSLQELGVKGYSCNYDD